MSLKVIRTGFGRTGTLSTKIALEQLGFGPCHQMVEVIGNPAQPVHWAAVAAGAEVDWADAFEGYCAQVDWPGVAVWRQTTIAFSAAKVVHTERPEEDWSKSFEKTIGKFMSIYPQMPLPPEIAGAFDTVEKLIIRSTFGGVGSRGSRRSQLIGGTMRLFAKVSRPVGFWCSTSPRAGNRSAASLTCRCQQRHSRGATSATSSGQSSAASPISLCPSTAAPPDGGDALHAIINQFEIRPGADWSKLAAPWVAQNIRPHLSGPSRRLVGEVVGGALAS
jgi:hypothetical protein